MEGKKGLKAEGRALESRYWCWGNEKGGFSRKSWDFGAAPHAQHSLSLSRGPGCILHPRWPAGIWYGQNKHVSMAIFLPSPCPPRPMENPSLSIPGGTLSSPCPYYRNMQNLQGPTHLSPCSHPITFQSVPKWALWDPTQLDAAHGWSLPCLFLIGALISCWLW